MKKYSTEIKNWFCRVALVAMLAMPATSCFSGYDDSEVRKEIEELKGELAELEEQFNSEIAALKELLEGKIVVKSIEPKSDGSIVVTLSNNSSFTVYPKGESVPAHLITVIEGTDGVLYWAMYDSDGNATVINDGNGNPVAVVDETPELRIAEDGKSVEVSFDGGTTWIPTNTESIADALISNIEVVYSEWQTDSEGNALPLYCVITLNDGAELKVGMNSRLILDFDSVYVGAGTTAELVATAEDASDFIITTPKGWGYEVSHEAAAGRFKLNFSAPSSTEIKSGEAVGEGVAKFIVVFDNGMSAIASIKLSTTPVYYSYLMGNIVVTVGGGIEEIVCGLVEADSFSADVAAENASKYLADRTQKTAYGVSFAKELSATISASALCSTLTPGAEYTFWYAIPKAGAQSVAANEISTEVYVYSVPSFEIENVSFFDAEVKFSVSGSNGYLVGFSPKSSFSNSACLNLYRENKDTGIALKQDIDYSGSFLEFFGVKGSALEYNTTYVAWFLECGGLEDVTTDHLCRWEFTTKNFEKGGNVEITTSNEVVEYTNISATLSTAGHIYMYYAFLEPYMVSGYPTDDDKLDMLISEGTKSRSTEPVKAQYHNATHNTTLTLVAVAVDKDGKYGKVFTKDYTTKAITYNEALNVTLSQPDSPSIVDVRSKIACDGAVSYRYICTPTGGSDWKKLYGGKPDKAGEYMIINPTGKGVCSTTDELNSLEKDADGNDYIVVKGLTEVEHVLVVLAVDENGAYSRAKAVYFIPTIDMGIIVRRSDANWSEGKPTVTLGNTQEIEFFNISWYVAPVEGYVAYTMAGNPSLLKDGECPTVEQLMAYIISDCSKDDSFTGDHGQKCEYSADGYWLSWGSEEDGDYYYEDNLPGVYNSFFYGDKGITMIYTIWVDGDGNFHEPMVYDPTEDVEVTDWTW